MKTAWRKTWIALFFLAHLSGALFPGAGSAQEKQAQKENFINLGLVSYSPDYTLAPDASFIVFKIKNNSARSISNIFGWVYRYQEGNDGNAANFVLVNNPNQGGMMLKSDRLAPGGVAEWKFALTKNAQAGKDKGKYALRISPKSIFFSRLGPGTKPGGPSKPSQE
ncbi:MAG: hypothetical protein HZA02_02280 [Nitrospinae bacterium]|nr:hypothetical protein [Nitrospinota bacterium]